MNSLRFRLLAAFFMVITVVVVVIGLALLVLLRDSALLDRPALVRLSQATRTLQRQAPLAEGVDDAQLQAYATRAAEAFEVRAVVVDGADQVLFDSAADAAPLAVALNTARNDPAYGLRIGRGRDAENTPWLYTVRRVAADRFLLLAAPQPRLAVLRLFVEDLLWPLVQAGAIAAVIALLLASLIARSVAHPLQQMARVAQAVARGEPAQPAAVAGPDEVRALGQAVNQMAEQVQASQQAQRDFLANVSHDLKTPLTSIQGFAQAIQEGAAESPEAVRRSAGIIYEEADRMRRLVADLLDLARLDAGLRQLNRAPVDLRTLLASLAEKFGPPAQTAGVALAVELPAHLPSLKGDADRLAQVFSNLLDNALKHTPAGGRVTLAALSLPEGGVQVSVADTGAGIPTADLPRVFERFYQVEKSRARRGGAGLGLAITKEIVEAHHGRLSVESVVGLGTRFVVRLPAALPDESTIIRRRPSGGGATPA